MTVAPHTWIGWLASAAFVAALTIPVRVNAQQDPGTTRATSPTAPFDPSRAERAYWVGAGLAVGGFAATAAAVGREAYTAQTGAPLSAPVVGALIFAPLLAGAGAHIHISAARARLAGTEVEVQPRIPSWVGWALIGAGWLVWEVAYLSPLSNSLPWAEAFVGGALVASSAVFASNVVLDPIVASSETQASLLLVPAGGSQDHPVHGLILTVRF